MARMSHPGIVAFYDSGTTSVGLLDMVMEFIDGCDLAQVIASRERLHGAEAMRIAAHVCDALHYAHSQGVVHRAHQACQHHDRE